MSRAHLSGGGDDSGQVLVGIGYPDVASYVSEQQKLTADAEWKKKLAGLDAVRPIAGRRLYQEITP